MKSIEITVQAVFWLELTREDLAPAFICAEMHYDGVCREAARPGGFLHLWREQISAFHGETTEPWKIKAEWRQLDTFLKICEPSRSLLQVHHLTREQYAALDKLCAQLLTAMRRATAIREGVATVRIEGPEKGDELAWSMSPGRF